LKKKLLKTLSYFLVCLLLLNSSLTINASAETIFGKLNSKKIFTKNNLKSKALLQQNVEAVNSTIELGGKITDSLYDASRNKAYAVDKEKKQLYVIDLINMILEKTVTLTYEPAGLCLSEDGAKIFIVNNDVNYLITEINLDTYTVTRNLNYSTKLDVSAYYGHRHVLSKQGKLYVVDGATDPKLYLFDANTFQNVVYAPEITSVGGLIISSDNKNLYTWYHSGWDGMPGVPYTISSGITKYSIGNNSFQQVDKFLDHTMEYISQPYSSPMFLLESKGMLLCKDRAFNTNSLSQTLVKYPDYVNSVDADSKYAAGYTFVFDISNGKVVRTLPNGSKSLFFDKNGLLFFLTGTKISYIDTKIPLENLNLKGNYPYEGQTDVAVNQTLVFEFDAILGYEYQGERYPHQGQIKFKCDNEDVQVVQAIASCKDNKLIIDPSAFFNFKYNSNYNITIEAGAVWEEATGRVNKDISLSFKTGQEFTRLAGVNRYQTSVEISKKGWKSAETVVLATGDNFPDALSAAPLAKKYGAPILLTNSKTLNVEVVNEIKRLGTKNVYIIGGVGAVSQSAEDTLVSMGIRCRRLCGKDRYDTSVSIAKELGPKEDIIIATGNNFPDALSIAPFAAAYEVPILLVNDSIMPSSIQGYIQENNIKTSVIVGGTGIISSGLERLLPNPVRLAGKNRYDTNFEIIKALGADPSYAYFATGVNFPDALAGAPIAANYYSPIILVDKGMDPEILQTWKINKDDMKMKCILGGTGAVPQDIINQIFY